MKISTKYLISLTCLCSVLWSGEILAQCSKSQLVSIGRFEHSNGQATIEFTDSEMKITQSNGVSTVRQFMQYSVSPGAITYTIVNARGSARAGLRTLLDQDFDSSIPVRNPGPHTVACSLSGSTLSFGSGTWAPW